MKLDDTFIRRDELGTGGNGAADSGKMAVFGSTGSLTISTGLLVNSSILGNTFVGAFTPRYIAGTQTVGANAGATWTISAPEFSSPSDSFVYYLPSKSGTFAMTSDIHVAATVSGNGITIAGQQISLSIGTGATQVAAGNHTHTAADVGAVGLTGDQTIAGIKSFSDNLLVGTTTDFTGYGGARLQIRQTGSSTSPKQWRGRVVAGGDAKVFLIGEYNGQAWLGGHNGALNAWDDIYIQPEGNKNVFIGYNGTTFSSTLLSVSKMAVGKATASVALDVVGGIAATGSVKVGSYAVAGVPSAATSGAGSVVFISNESGGAVLAFSDGTDWRRVTDRAIIS